MTNQPNEHFSKGKPSEPGTYIVNIPFVGSMLAKFIDGCWYFQNGNKIPDSIVVGWK